MLHHIADDFAFMICLKDLHGVFPGPAAARKKKKSQEDRDTGKIRQMAKHHFQ